MALSRRERKSSKISSGVFSFLLRDEEDRGV